MHSLSNAGLGDIVEGVAFIRILLGSLPRASNRHTVSIELMIFVIAALTGARVSEIVDELDRRDPLDHLEA
jgi:hypothetical protein